jgi:hypothetical protein
MNDAFKLAARYNTQERNLAKWRDAYIDTINAKHAEKLRLLRAALTPEAAAIVVAAERARAAPVAADIHPIESATNDTEPPQLSPRLTAPVPAAPKPIESELREKGARR